MEDNCFMCLNNSLKKRCSVCSIRCHNKCWSLFIKKTIGIPTSDVNIDCPQCRSIIRVYGPSPRLHQSATYVKNVINEKLRRCDDAIGTDNKKNITVEIFEYLYVNMWFINNHKKVKICVKNKLISLYLEYSWEYARDMYEKMFGEPIPSKLE